MVQKILAFSVCIFKLMDCKYTHINLIHHKSGLSKAKERPMYHV